MISFIDGACADGALRAGRHRAGQRPSSPVHSAAVQSSLNPLLASSVHVRQGIPPQMRMNTWLHAMLRWRRRHVPHVTPAHRGAAASVRFAGDSQLREHARALARRHHLLPGSGADDLQQRLGEAEAALDRAFQAARASASGEHPLEPAAQWLIDNFYVIKEQAKEVRTGLPRSYRRELPALLEAGQRVPRILVLMRELLRHAEGGLRIEDVVEFVAAYQESTRLTLGELWSIPLLLRFALLERLRPLADAVVTRLHDTAAAAQWASKLMETARARPAEIVLAVADMARARVSLSPAWVSEFQRSMQGGNPALGLALLWLEQQLAAHHLSVAEAMEQESRAQAAAQVAISTCIGDMRLIGRSDWSRVVESLSAVEAWLREDPAGVYADMDFTTRDRYRHIVEVLARHCPLPEWDVAAHATALAARAEASGEDPRQRQVAGLRWLDPAPDVGVRGDRRAWPGTFRSRARGAHGDGAGGRRQPLECRHRQLAGYAVATTAVALPPRAGGRHSGRAAHAGGGALPARQCSGNRGTGGVAGNPLPRQPRSEPLFRAARGLRRRPE
jgi:hypothetical protein